MSDDVDLPWALRAPPNPDAETRVAAIARDPRASRAPHYKVIRISIYTKDLEHLDQMVDELKASGITKANRSALIRHALSTVDLTKVPRGL